MTADLLPYLDTFVRAAELNSFTAAARALSLTQAAVSQRVHVLEHSLGVLLFHRRGGRVLLTEAGHRLHGYAQEIFGLHRKARLEVSGCRGPLTGELSLAASSVPGEHLLPELLDAFHQRHPHVQVRATVGDSQAVLKQVEHGQAHLGLVGGKGDSAHLDYRCFARDKLALIVPFPHPWWQRKRISLRELSGQPLILREAGSGSRWCLERALAASGRSLRDVRVVLELGSNEAIKEAILRGMGLAVLSTHAVEKEIAAGQLRAIPVSGLPLFREMFAVWDRRRVLPIPARLFVDLLGTCPTAGARS
jgi:DNA-binding transcriptional LysR family regulator